MFIPFTKMFSGENAAQAEAESARKNVNFHPNNPRYHRFPFLRRMQELFVNSLNGQLFILDNLPRELHFFTCVVYLSLLVALFVVLFVRGYDSAKGQTYLAPSDGREASPNCELIPAVNTGTYYATVDGYWQGTEGFLYSKAAYVLVISTSLSFEKLYGSTLHLVYANLRKRGQWGENQDLSKNLLIWMATTMSVDATNAQRMYLIGNPLQVFNRQLHRASIATTELRCNVTSSTSFDSSNGVLTTSFPIDYFTAPRECGKVMQPDRLGYDYIAQPDDFNLVLDTRTLVTAVAVNTNLLRLERLVHVPALDKNITVNGTASLRLPSKAYYDTKHPGMTPIRCIHTETASPLCVLEIGAVPVFPFFHHSGQSTHFPSPCDCSKLDRTELGQNAAHPCHEFRFLLGFYFWNSEELSPLLETLQKHNNNATVFHDKGFEAAFRSSSFGANYANSVNSTIDDGEEGELREAAFSFCQSKTHGACSIFSVSSYDAFNQGNTISEYYFQLQKGACRDTLEPNETALDMLVSRPYMPLYQEYQTCIDGERTLLANQAGITFGNIQLAAPFVALALLLLGLFIRFLCGLCGNRSENEWYEELMHRHYAQTEKQQVLDVLAQAMLIQRDRILTKKLQGTDCLDDSSLYWLVQDLVRHYNEGETKDRVRDFLRNSRLKSWKHQRKLQKMKSQQLQLQQLLDDPHSQWGGDIERANGNNDTFPLVEGDKFVCDGDGDQRPASDCSSLSGDVEMTERRSLSVEEEQVEQGEGKEKSDREGEREMELLFP